MSAPAVALPAPLVKPTRHPIKWTRQKVQLFLSAAVMTYVGVLIVAGLYYLLTQTTTTMDNAWHNLVPDDALRHNIRNVGEGFLGGLLAQMIIWNHYKKVVSKKRNRLDKVEIALHIPNVKDGKPLSLGQLLASPWLALLYGIPGFLLLRWVAVKAGHTMDEASSTLVAVHGNSLLVSAQEAFTDKWPEKVMGFGAAFVFGRRPAKGVFDDLQLWFAQLRVAQGKPTRWWHPPTYVARYNEARRDVTAHYIKVPGWQRPLLQGMLVVGGLLAIFGFYVLNFIAKGRPLEPAVAIGLLVLILLLPSISAFVWKKIRS